MNEFTIWDLHNHLSVVEGRTPEERMAQLIEIRRSHGHRADVRLHGHALAHNPRRKDCAKKTTRSCRPCSIITIGPSASSMSAASTSRPAWPRSTAASPTGRWSASSCGSPRRPAPRELDPIIGRAAALKAVIFQHTWFKTDNSMYRGESTPDDLVALARRHPTVPLICGHTGGTWELGIRAVRANPTSRSTWPAGIRPAASMEMAVRELGAERVIYGSDAGGQASRRNWPRFMGARIPDEAKQRIFRDNFRELLLPILADKGVAA